MRGKMSVRGRVAWGLNAGIPFNLMTGNTMDVPVDWAGEQDFSAANESCLLRRRGQGAFSITHSRQRAVTVTVADVMYQFGLLRSRFNVTPMIGP